MILLMAAALLVLGAAPAIAAPGGVPGPPPDHDKAKDKVVDDEVAGDEEVVTESAVPDWAKAYGKRIKDAYGVPFGHVQQCIGSIDDVDGDDVDGDDVDDPKKALEACEDILTEFPNVTEFPEDESGAMAFWVFTESNLLIVGT